MSDGHGSAASPFPPEVNAKLSQMQQIQFWVVFMEPQGSWSLDNPDIHKTMLSHIEWLERLESEGKILLSGPLGLPDWDGTGMAILRADDFEAAKTLAETEPFHNLGVRKNRVKAWNVNEGTLLLRVEIFSGKGRLS